MKNGSWYKGVESGGRKMGAEVRSAAPSVNNSSMKAHATLLSPILRHLMAHVRSQLEMAFPDDSEAHTDRQPSQQLLKELSDAFQFFDLDGDEKLSLTELGTVVGELGDAVTEDELRGLIKRVDSDGDGQLDLCEFIDLNMIKGEDRQPSQELSKELSDLFQFFDLDGDEKLSLTELGTVVGELGDAVTEDELRGLIKRVDSDGDGQLDLCEFIDLHVIKGEEQPAVDAAVAAFDRFDADKDGFISSEELHRVLAGFGEEKFSLEDCRCMIKSVDENGDQVMSLTEFQALMSDNAGLGLVAVP